jgi:TolB-like protein/predicted Zn-dependent protease
MVNHYRVIRKIGSGGMGEVYLAEDTKLHRNVALKLLSSYYSSDADLKKRFMREAEATASLSHPGIVTIHEVDEHEGRPYFVMELVEGRSLSEYVKGKTLSFDELIDLMMLVCDGLAAAHGKGIVHRDMKPSNILVDSYGRPRIVDFGLAAISGGEQLTKTGSTLGTIGYMSPEQARGSGVDERSDLFSLGVVLYELVAARNPFTRQNHIATMQAILSETPDPLLRYRSDVPDILQGIVSKLLEKNRDLRYQSAKEVMADLRRLRSQSEPERFTETFMSVAQPGRGRRRRRIALAAGSALGAVAILIAAYFAISTVGDDGSSTGEGLIWDNSIAVLPFRDFSPNKDQEYLCDGMTDAIIGKLSVLNKLKVISMTSVMRYKEADRDIRKIGRELGVSTVLEGTVQRENQRIRVRAQLISVDSDAHLWSQTYDRELESIFSVQDDISRSIANAMELRLLGDEEQRLERHSTGNVDAYNLYMQGRYSWRKRTEEHIRSAIQFFERAIRLDTNYALAYSGLADAWAVLPSYSSHPRDEGIANAKRAASRALEIDDKLAEAHASMGLILYNDDEEEAENEFKKAIDLNPGYSWAHVWYSNLLNRQNRFEESVRQLEIAYRLDPLNTVTLINLALRKAAVYQWDEAGEYHRRALEIEPTSNVRDRYARYLANRGEFEEALEHYLQIIEEQPDDAGAYFEASEIYGVQGRFGEALDLIDRYFEASADSLMTEYLRGNFYYQVEQYDSALIYYNRALEIRPDSVGLLEEIGLTLSQLGDSDAAIETADRLTGLRPDVSGSWYVAGQVHLLSDRPDDALSAYRRAFDLNTESVGALQGHLAACLYLREFDQAEALIEEISESTHESFKATAVIGRAGMHILQGKLQESLAVLNSSLAADSTPGQYTSAYFKSILRMLVLHQLGDRRSALADASRVIELRSRISPGDVLAWRDYRAGLLAEIGDFDRAEAVVDDLRRRIESRRIESSGQSLDTFGLDLSLGSVALAKGDAYEAVGHLEAAVRGSSNRFSVNFLQSRLMLGRAYLEAGMNEEAKHQFALLKSIKAPDFLVAATWVAMIPYYLAVACDRSGELETARDYYREFVEAWGEADAEITELSDARSRLSELQN